MLYSLSFMFYDINKTLSYNCLFNFVVGNKGAGKTYGAKTWAVRDFIKNQNEFIYLRRYETELDKLTGKNGKFFTDIKDEFPNDELLIDGHNYICNESICGYAIPLTSMSKIKSTPFPNVQTIIFDEFLITDGKQYYLPNEVRAFLEFYESVARPGTRKKEPKVLFYANSTEMTNPYFLYFNLSLPYGNDCVKNGEILLQMVNNDEFIKKKQSTRFGSIVQNTEYEDYAFKNKFVDNTKCFVSHKTSKCVYDFTIKYSGEFFGVWIDLITGAFYVSNDVDTSCLRIYTVQNSDHCEGTLLLKSLRNAPRVKRMVDAYKIGQVFFESPKIRNVVFEVIKTCLV